MRTLKTAQKIGAHAASLGIIPADYSTVEAQAEAERVHAERTVLLGYPASIEDGTVPKLEDGMTFDGHRIWISPEHPAMISLRAAAEQTGTTPPARSARAKLGMRGIISLLLSIVKAR